MEQQKPSSSDWQGKVELVYGHREGKCVPIKTFTQAPFKVQRPLYPESEAVCHTVLVHTAGGMVGGDTLAIEITLQPQCRAVVTTAAASKVYGSPHHHSHQTIQLCLSQDSCLEWFPQDTILFDQANYRQTLQVDLAPGALWCGWDITRFGRSARGEQFNQGHWRSQIDVWQAGQLLWRDCQGLTGGSPVLHSPSGLGGYPVVGSFALVGRSLEPDQLHVLRSLWPGDVPGDRGLTRLQNGLLCRYRGPSSQRARQWFVMLWQHLRPWYLGQVAQVPRVWQR